MFKAALLLVLATVAQPIFAQLPDPTERTSMVGPRGASAGATQWILQSTLVSDERRLAVINGQTVRVGDDIAGARVSQIEPYAVRLRTANGFVEIRLTDGDPKQVAREGGD